MRDQAGQPDSLLQMAADAAVRSLLSPEELEEALRKHGQHTRTWLDVRGNCGHPFDDRGVSMLADVSMLAFYKSSRRVAMRQWQVPAVLQDAWGLNWTQLSKEG